VLLFLRLLAVLLLLCRCYNDAVLFEKIKSGNYDADDPIWENISAQAKDIVAKLLTASRLKQRLCGVLWCVSCACV